MLTKSLAKVLDLIKKTGDRLIVFDQSGEAYAIMDLNEYERLIKGGEGVSELTEKALLDKINRDIAVWKREQSDSEMANFSEKELSIPSHLDQNTGFEQIGDQVSFEDEFENEIVDDPEDEEDTYYLEKVPF